MNAKPVRKLMDVLNTVPDKPQALFVGGCVRNTLLGQKVEDIDIATRWTPQETIDLCTAAGIKTVPTGLDHGMITAVVDGQNIEITTLRKDVETDGRRAVVAFTKEWSEDAQRRDFTMNTLLADECSNVYDPTGQGMSDLEKRRVVFVGDPAQRIAEDALRVLRFFRFHGFYGAGDPDAQALKACRAASDQINILSRERITQEVFKMLAHERTASILTLMFENNVLADLPARTYQSKMLEHVCHFQKRYHCAAIAPRLHILAGMNLEGVSALQNKLLIPKVFVKDITAIDKALSLPDLTNDHAVKVAVYRYGRTAALQTLMIQLAQDRTSTSYALQAIDIIQNWEIPNFPITGDDLIKAGQTPGPELGDKLEEMETAWINRGFKR